MSNTRKPTWTEAEITAANAEAFLGEVWLEAEANAAREVIGGRFLAELAAEGHDPGFIAALEQRFMDLGTDFWAGIHRTVTR